eukprot:PhF_6_TR30685/c0_g1_i2/m.45147
MSSRIPTVCLGSPSFAKDVVSALQSIGFVYLTNTSIDVEHHLKVGRQVMTVLKEVGWNKIPQEPTGFRGFYQYFSASGHLDPIHCLSVGNCWEQDPSTLRKQYFVDIAGYKEVPHSHRRSNWWGPLSLDLQKEVGDTYSACHSTCMDVLRAVESEMGLRNLVSSHDKKDHDLQYKHYPASRVVLNKIETTIDAAVQDPHAYEGNTHVRLATHVDLSTITLLCQDQIGGLEIFDPTSEKFEAVPARKDAVLCNAGALLEEWSYGEIPAVPHRVTFQGETDRTSVVFFCWPNHDAEVVPLGCEKVKGMKFHVGDRMPMFDV